MISLLAHHCEMCLWPIGSDTLNHPETVWTNEVHEAHLWYHGADALKHNTLDSRHGGSSTKNGTKAESNPP